MPRRDIPSLIATVLAGAPLAGCPSTWNCHPPSEAVDLVGADVLRQDLEGVEEGGDALCERLCQEVYHRERGWFLSEVDSCAHTLSDTQAEGGAPTDVVGEVSCEGTGIEYYCEGRRPLGHVEQAGQGDDPEGRTLATLAHLEAAAVDAFVELEALLAAHGAPVDLRGRCRQAAADERVHAAMLTALAARRGARVPAPRTVDRAHDLLALALSNAVEGCVHETWAALEAALVARQARDPAVRAAFARIARDEAAHAQLSWDLDAWLHGCLSAQSRGRHSAQWGPVEDARRRALADLPGQARAVARQVPAGLGFPDPEQAADLAAALAEGLAA